MDTIKTKVMFHLGGHAVSLVPGLPGNFVRGAYYLMTLDRFHPTALIAFGSYFSRRGARVSARVGIGAYCVIGLADMSPGACLASRVSTVSGLHEHGDTASRAHSEAGSCPLPGNGKPRPLPPHCSQQDNRTTGWSHFYAGQPAVYKTLMGLATT